MDQATDRDLRILLEALKGQLTVLNANLVNQSVIINRLDERIQKLECCPCPVHRDAGAKCPVDAVEDEVSKLKARLNYYIGGAMALWMAVQIWLKWKD